MRQKNYSQKGEYILYYNEWFPADFRGDILVNTNTMCDNYK